MSFVLLVIAMVATRQLPNTPKSLDRSPRSQPIAAPTTSAGDPHSTMASPSVIRKSRPDSARQARLDEEERTRKAETDLWLVGLTAGLVLVGLGQLVLFWWQLRLIRKSLVDTKSAADAANSGAAAAMRAAEAAVAQSKTASEELHLSHRAWLGISHIVRTLEPLTFNATGATTKIQFEVTNGGNSPAKNANFIKMMIVSPFPPPDPRTIVDRVNPAELLELTSQSGILILPNQTVDIPGPVDCPIQRFVPGADGKVTVWVTGYIGYRDEFDLPHATNFLLRYRTSSQQFGFLPSGRINGEFELMGVIPIAY